MRGARRLHWDVKVHGWDISWLLSVNIVALNQKSKVHGLHITCPVSENYITATYNQIMSSHNINVYPFKVSPSLELEVGMPLRYLFWSKAPYLIWVSYALGKTRPKASDFLVLRNGSYKHGICFVTYVELHVCICAILICRRKATSMHF